MTNNSEKTRAVVLAALMVFSVFAGTVAFAGMTAASSDKNMTSASITAEPNGAGDSANHTVTFNLSSSKSIQKYRINYTAADISNVGQEDIVRFGEDTDGDGTIEEDYTSSSSDASGVNSVSATNNGETLTIQTSSSQKVDNSSTVILEFTDAVNPSNTGDYNVTIIAAPDSDYAHATRTLNIGQTTQTASVNFTDQDSSGSSVTVDSVNMSDGGFVAIHNSSGDIIGYSNYLSGGEHTNVDISLSQEISADENLTAMAHKDTDNDQTFDAPDNDGPYTDNNGDPVTDTAFVTYTSGNAKVLSATHYESSGNGHVVEVAFNETVGVSGTTFTLGFEDGTTKQYHASDNEVEHTGNGRVIVKTSELHSDIKNVSVPDSVSPSDDTEVTFAPTTVTDSSDTTGYVGSNVAFEASNTEATIEFDGPSYNPTRGTGTGSYVYVVDTTDFETGTYNATFGDSGNTGVVELSELGLGVSATNVTNEEGVSATVTADDINRDIEVSLLDSDDEVVTTKTATIDADGEVTVTFDSQSTGEYTVEVTDVATGVTASDSLTVSEAATGSVDFGETSSYEVDQGDVAAVTVNFDGGADTATLVVGNEESSGYQANITVHDDSGDGQVTVRFNTYTAGTSDTVVTTANSEDDVTLDSQTGLTSILETGGYDLTVVKGDTTVESAFTTSSADFGSVYIAERATESMSLWTAPGSAGADGVFDATLTQDTTIASGDWVVHQVSASGLGGHVEAHGGFGETLGHGLNVSVEQTGGVPANTKAKTLNLSASMDANAVELWADADNDTYYIAVDTESAVFDRGDKTGLSAKSGEEYTTTFTVDDTELIGDEAESVEGTFEVVAPSTSLDETPVTVEAAENQSIAGSSTLAPGTEISVTVKSTGDTEPRFYESGTATVQADGTWAVEFDVFADQSAGDTFEIEGDVTADGEVVKAQTPTPTATEEPSTDTPTETQTATPTDTATPTNTATPTDTEAVTDTQSETDTETTTETPGFGVAVALVALLAAALLAGRREN